MRSYSSLSVLIIMTMMTQDSYSFSITPTINSFVSRKGVIVSSTASSPPPSGGVIDFARARECVDHEGACDLEEMEEMRNALKAERIKDFLSTSLYYMYPSGAPSAPWNPNDSMEKRLLEDDLSHQLQLLKEHEAQQTLPQTSSSSPPKSVSKNRNVMTKRQDFIPHASSTTTAVSTSSMSSPSSASFVSMLKLLNEPSKDMLILSLAVAIMMIFPFVTQV